MKNLIINIFLMIGCSIEGFCCYFQSRKAEYQSYVAYIYHFVKFLNCATLSTALVSKHQTADW